MRMYGLRSYCVDRDPEGNVTEIVLKEQVSRRYIPIKLTNAEDEQDDRAAVYTHVTLTLIRTGLSGIRSLRARSCRTAMASAGWITTRSWCCACIGSQVNRTVARLSRT